MLSLRTTSRAAQAASVPLVRARALSTTPRLALDHQTWDRTASAERAGERSFSPRGQRSQGQSGQAGSQSQRRDAGGERLAAAQAYHAKRATMAPPHMLTLADFSADEIVGLVQRALALKLLVKTYGAATVQRSLDSQTVALLFSKRSTRTRVASETSTALLGGHAMFLGSGDIQLGVNESLRDTASVVGSMVNGIMARVAGHDEVETLAKHSPVPVVNALSDLYHPTQILADLLTMVELYSPGLELPDLSAQRSAPGKLATRDARRWARSVDVLSLLKGRKFAYVGDTNNMSNEFIVSLPRLGMTVAIASPEGYNSIDPRVWARVEEAGTQDRIQLTTSPAEAIKDADLIVTDTWISMGQEEETAKRLEAFKGYQLTNALIEGSAPKPDWRFMHCLPRHKDEVDDEVFYGPRSVVFPEAENRKWTIMAVFDALIGQWARS